MGTNLRSSKTNFMEIEHRVSIIIPIYNVKNYLERSLQSVFNQSYKDWETIAVDDGSTDGTSILLDELAKKYSDSRLKVFHNQNEGPSAARNFGIKKSLGQYLLFLDSDDMLSRNLLSDAIESANKFLTDIVLSPYIEINKFDQFLPTNYLSNIYRNTNEKLSGKFMLDLLLREKIKNYACQFLIRTKLIHKYDIEFPVGVLFEDIATTYKFFQNSRFVSIINTASYLYRKNSNSIVNSALSSKSINDYTIASKSVYKDIGEKITD